MKIRRHTLSLKDISLKKKKIQEAERRSNELEDSEKNKAPKKNGHCGD
jgi:hypothetical protein